MRICNKCGVELDDGMKICPLCETMISDDFGQPEIKNTESQQPVDRDKRDVMQHILWQVTMVLLVSGILAALIINLSIVGRITWAIYPITICLVLLGYVSLLALWRMSFISRLLIGWLVSILQLAIISRFTPTDWPLLLAIPLVSSVSIVGILLGLALTKLKTKGLNVLAIVFVSLAVLALMVESVVSWYTNRSIVLGWSVIVAACLLPVTAAILFMYFRTRNNSELKKIFHT